MKNISKFSCFLLLLLFLLPTIRTGAANDTPDYVGIGSSYKDYYIYTTTFDKDPYENFLEDAGYTDTEAENITDKMFDDEFGENIAEWRILIGEIEKEKQIEYDDDDIGYVKCHYSMYYDNEYGQYAGYIGDVKDYIFEYDKDLYVNMVSYEMGLFFLFVAEDVNWNRVARNVDEEWGDDWDDDNEKGSAEVEKSWFYFSENPNGISTCWNPDDEDFEDFESISIYNDDGVLIYYEWTYDGDIIWKLELRNRFANEYWWVFIVITIAGTAVVAILTLTIISRKKPMMIVLMGCVFIVIFLIIGQAFIINNLYMVERWL